MARTARTMWTRRLAALGSLWRARRTGGGPPLRQRVRAVPTLVRDTVTGRYPGLSRARLAVLAVAVLYLVSPVDVVPELLVPVLGLGDDAVVAMGLAASLLVETERYLRFRGRERAGLPADG